MIHVHNTGLCWHKAGELELAAKAYRKSLHLAADSDTYENLGVVLAEVQLVHVLRC